MSAETEPLRMAVLVGIQASGKTTFFRQRLAGFAHVSKDNFRHNKNKPRRQAELIRDAAEKAQNVCVDNTHFSRADRTVIFALGHELGYRVEGYVFEFDRERTLAWNLERPERDQVREAGIWSTVAQFEPVTLGEGFDAIFQVTPDGAGGFRVSDWRSDEPEGV